MSLEKATHCPKACVQLAADTLVTYGSARWDCSGIRNDVCVTLKLQDQPNYQWQNMASEFDVPQLVRLLGTSVSAHYSLKATSKAIKQLSASAYGTLLELDEVRSVQAWGATA